MQWMLLTVGVCGFAGHLTELRGAALGRISAILEERFVLNFMSQRESFLIQDVKIYELRGRHLTLLEARNRIRSGGLVLIVSKKIQPELPAWSDLWSDVLFLPRDTLVVIIDGIWVTGRLAGRPVEPISCFQVIEHALIDRPRELLQLTHKAVLEAIKPLITVGFYPVPARVARR